MPNQLSEAGQAGGRIWTAVIGSPVGDLTAYADDRAVHALLFDGHRVAGEPVVWPPGEPLPNTCPVRRVAAAEHPVLARLAAQLTEYFDGARHTFDLPLQLHGNAFQRRVWEALRTIPYGQTRSYGQLAVQLGEPGAARAVGAANARNPISIVIGCHRVVGGSGALVGYAGGLDRKRFLLDLEAGEHSARLF